MFSLCCTGDVRVHIKENFQKKIKSRVEESKVHLDTSRPTVTCGHSALDYTLFKGVKKEVYFTVATVGLDRSRCKSKDVKS